MVNFESKFEEKQTNFVSINLKFILVFRCKGAFEYSSK